MLTCRDNVRDDNDDHRQHRYHYHSHQGLLTLAFHQSNGDCREGGTSSHVHVTAEPGDDDGDDNDVDDHDVEEDDDKSKPDQSPHNVNLALGSRHMERVDSPLQKNLAVRRQNQVGSVEKQPRYLLVGLEHGDGKGGDSVLGAGVDVDLLPRQQHLHDGQVSLEAGQPQGSDPVLADGVDLHVLPLEDALDHPPVALDAGEHERAELKLSGEVHIQVGSAKERQGDLDGKWG